MEVPIREAEQPLMANANDNHWVTRYRNINFAYGEWLESLSEADYLAELDRVRNNGIGNAPPE